MFTRTEAPIDGTATAPDSSATRPAAPLLLSTNEAAALLGIGRSKLYDLIATGAHKGVGVDGMDVGVRAGQRAQQPPRGLRLGLQLLGPRGDAGDLGHA